MIDLRRATHDTSSCGRTWEEIVTLLQSWCYFGLLIEIFAIAGIFVEIEDFLSPERITHGNQERVVTSQKLSKLLRDWEAKAVCLDTKSQAAPFCAVSRVLRTASVYIHCLWRDGVGHFSNKGISARCTWNSEHLLGSTIQLSILILGEYLETGQKLYNPSPQHEETEPDWQVSLMLKFRMLEAGWCLSEFYSLLDRKAVGNATLYYLSLINRWSLGKDHRNCQWSRHCTLAVDDATYCTRHKHDCWRKSCLEIIVDGPKSRYISSILQQGSIPLLTIQKNKPDKLIVTIMTADTDLLLDNTYAEGNSADEVIYFSAKANKASAQATSSVRSYVCISHVWTEYVKFDLCSVIG